MAVEELVPIMQDMLRSIPIILQGFEILAIAVAVLFFGKMVVKGLRKKPESLKLPLIILTGIFCLLAAPVVYSFLNLNLELLAIFQPEIIIGGLLSAFITGLALWLLTSGLKDDRYAVLWNEIESLKEILTKSKVLKTLTDKEAKKIAEDTIQAKPLKAVLTKDAWNVQTDKNGRDVTVAIDAVTGRVRRVIWHKSRFMNYLMTDKLRIIGLVILLGFIILVAGLFRGFPSFNLPLESMGMSADLFTDLADMGNEFAPEGCISLYELQQMIDARSPLPQHEDEEMADVFKNRSGKRAIQMILLEEKRNIILAVMEDNSLCYSQAGNFCRCVDSQ
ncbi:MAG: PepSY domain-containing protein [Candidatus Aenigmatarchaeota archaeon]